ncbi:MAG: aminotransferase class V-fold PLP-dependent enzyme [Paracoccaceae bacterium]|nr:aminotransferase class V-fold PLP-dependent enzyme [Paracoccaceae bacterium]MDE2911466.1 aminotransferase class V-fold PLP-dependent enzyme [Paracoccaceae bacterium]
MPLDLNHVRSQFPAFSEPCLADKPFFENAGGSFPCGQVVDRLTRFYRQRKVQPYGPYAASAAGGEEMDEARLRLAGILGIETDEIGFGPSTTQNTYVLAQAFGTRLEPGDAIIVTDQDHEANIGPWRRLSRQGIEIRLWKLDPETGHLPIAGLERWLDQRVRLVCFPHCSNIVGEINPVEEICKLVREAGAWSCVDGVSFAPHGLPNIGRLGSDIYLFSTYKTYGPHQGIMAVRRPLLDWLPNQGHDFNADLRALRLTPAGPDHAQIAACAGIADYVDWLHDHHGGSGTSAAGRGEFVGRLMREHERRLLQPLLDAVSSRNSVRLIGPARPDRKVPTVSMLLDRPGRTGAESLAELGIMIGGGDFYGVRCLKALGVDPGFGVLRASFVHYTSAEDVQRLIEALDRIL